MAVEQADQGEGRARGPEAEVSMERGPADARLRFLRLAPTPTAEGWAPLLREGIEALARGEGPAKALAAFGAGASPLARVGRGDALLAAIDAGLDWGRCAPIRAAQLAAGADRHQAQEALEAALAPLPEGDPRLAARRSVAEGICAEGWDPGALALAALRRLASPVMFRGSEQRDRMRSQLGWAREALAGRWGERPSSDAAAAGRLSLEMERLEGAAGGAEVEAALAGFDEALAWAGRGAAAGDPQRPGLGLSRFRRARLSGGGWLKLGAARLSGLLATDVGGQGWPWGRLLRGEGFAELLRQIDACQALGADDWRSIVQGCESLRATQSAKSVSAGFAEIEAAGGLSAEGAAQASVATAWRWLSMMGSGTPWEPALLLKAAPRLPAASRLLWAGAFAKALRQAEADEAAGAELGGAKLFAGRRGIELAPGVREEVERFIASALGAGGDGKGKAPLAAGGESLIEAALGAARAEARDGAASIPEALACAWGDPSLARRCEPGDGGALEMLAAAGRLEELREALASGGWDGRLFELLKKSAAAGDGFSDEAFKALCERLEAAAAGGSAGRPDWLGARLEAALMERRHRLGEWRGEGKSLSPAEALAARSLAEALPAEAWAKGGAPGARALCGASPAGAPVCAESLLRLTQLIGEGERGPHGFEPFPWAEAMIEEAIAAGGVAWTDGQLGALGNGIEASKPGRLRRSAVWGTPGERALAWIDSLGRSGVDWLRVGACSEGGLTDSSAAHALRSLEAGGREAAARDAVRKVFERVEGGFEGVGGDARLASWAQNIWAALGEDAAAIEAAAALGAKAPKAFALWERGSIGAATADPEARDALASGSERRRRL